MSRIRIGTRGSRLALWQAASVEKGLHRVAPEIDCEIIVIATQGDRDKTSSLTRIGGMGVFTKEIERALADNEIDIAVHSLKDLPTEMTEGLELAAVPERGPVEDALVSLRGLSLGELPEGAVIGTGSIRRRSQLLRRRPDLRMKDLRGNIETRLRKLYSGEYDAIMMARAAMVRLGLQMVLYSVFDRGDIIPAVGQGAIGVQIREGDHSVRKTISALDHLPTHRAATAERAFLRALDSGCRFPVGANAVVVGNRLDMIGYVGSVDGKTAYTEIHSGPGESAAGAGEELAGRLIDAGALRLLKDYRNGKTTP